MVQRFPGKVSRNSEGCWISWMQTWVGSSSDLVKISKGTWSFGVLRLRCFKSNISFWLVFFNFCIVLFCCPPWEITQESIAPAWTQRLSIRPITLPITNRKSQWDADRNLKQMHMRRTPMGRQTCLWNHSCQLRWNTFRLRVIWLNTEYRKRICILVLGDL